MGCFTLGYIEQLLIWLIVLGAFVACVRLLLPNILGTFPGGALILQILNIIMWAVVLIFCVILVFDLLSCVVGTPFFHGPFVR